MQHILRQSFPICLVAASLLSFSTQSSSAALLVKDARPAAGILLASDDKTEQLAGQEIQTYIQKISGAVLPLVTVEPDAIGRRVQQLKAAGSTAILLGSANSLASLKPRIQARGQDPAAFALLVTPSEIHIQGLSPEGTLNGTYELLEQVGVRWFMPGELGTVIPSQKTVAVLEQDTIQVPSFPARWHRGSLFADWGRHVRMGGPYFPPSHGMPGIDAKKDFALHPEWFSLVNGKRVPRKLCISNPQVLQRVIDATKAYFKANPEAQWIGMGPSDGFGFCECDQCKALDAGDWDPFSNQTSMTDRYIWFFNRVLDGIKDEYPDKKLGFYAYSAYMRPPLRENPSPRIVPAFAPISICRIHGMNNPICPERSYYRSIIQAWGKIVPDVYERGYFFNLADPGFPFSEVHKIRDEIPAAHDLGITGWRTETANHWGSETPTLYIAARLMWNSRADVNALLQDFYDKFFGPASAPMHKYGDLMDAALRDGDYHTGGSQDLPLFYPAPLRRQAAAYLTEAAKLAPQGEYRLRVELFTRTFNYLQSFIAMEEHRNEFDFVAAKANLADLDAQQKVLLAYDPPMINARSALNYVQRYWRLPVEQGYARTTDGNELVARLADQWSFLEDPQGVGEDIGYWRPGSMGGNWRPLKTSSLSWSDQGLRYAKGQAWYRQQVNIPPKYAGKRIFLWFGGVDEKAKVWLNGKLLGISPGSAFQPFEMDASKAVQAGKINTLVVAVVNNRVDELGSGGIVAPVMFYAPAAGDKAQLENTKDLGETFP